MTVLFKSITIYLLVLPCFLSGQNQSGKLNQSLPQRQINGLPIIRNYLPSEYNATPQNWSIIKDSRGIMYFANTAGVLEYDGVEWRLIQITNEVSRTLAIDDNGIVYVGGIDEFGYLQPDIKGEMRYKSLVSLLPPGEREFGDIWSIWPTDRGIFFQSSSHLFFIKDPVQSLENHKPANLKTWMPKTVFSPAFYVNHKYYIPETGTGLLTLNGDSLTLAPNGELFSKETIYDMLTYVSDDKTEAVGSKILVGTAGNGFYFYDGRKFTSFKTEADAYIKKNKLYFRGGILKNNCYVFGTQTGGLFVINNKGKLLQIINKKNGLSDNTVWFVYPDDAGVLWVGLNNGIARIIY
ncbi:MAG TPA: two-component regulator propeller domain-containing protein, partial [Ignavibacteriaceae bacterium]